MPFYPTLILLVVAILLAACGDLVSAILCRKDEGAALLRLKSNFRFDHALSNLSSWQGGTDCCTWQGITCDAASGLVVALDLTSLVISGNLTTDLFSLTALRFLSLADNDFIAISLPSVGFELLTNLRYLNLSQSGFVGQVPIGIGRLPNLATLHLSGAFIWDGVLSKPGPFLELKNPSFQTLIANLSNLQKLHLDYVNISMKREQAFANARPILQLQELSLTSSWITGPIDNSLAKLQSLSKLILDDNMFGCPVPEFFAELSSLRVLSLRRSGLLGVFPSRIFHLKHLTVLDASYNEMLYGELPEFTRVSALQRLVLTGTNFSGKIPESISNLRNLSVLDLSGCQFHGAMPSSFAQWPVISTIDLSGNNLVGSLPSDGYNSLHNLTAIYLRNNSISGEIPASLFSHPSLRSLDLSYNNFTGILLLYPNVSSRLEFIDLSVNKLRGPIPKSLSELSGLEVLDLSSNKLAGTMYLNLIENYRNLSVLYLSENRLSILEEDDDESSVAEYPKIRSLGLASCNLTKVPNFLSYQTEIERLDLSNNKIAGAIPHWIWRAGMNTFYYIDISHNMFTSVQGRMAAPDYLFLDLHSNKLEGSLPIPPPNTSYLDYSNNLFTSSIPTKFVSHVSSAYFL